MKLPFKKEEFLGNIRSGNRRENNSPRNLSYFDVHLDNYTSEFSIELFNSIYNQNTSILKIKPINNIFITYEIYNKDIKCQGKNGKAVRIVNKGQKQEGICKEEECELCQKGKCSKVGRLYFRLSGIEERGIWCYSTRSRGIEYIEKYLNLMIEKGTDITKNYFELSLNEKNGKSGKVYVPDIKLIKEESREANKNSNKKENQKNKSSDNCYKYIKGQMVEYDGQKIPKLIFVKRDGKEKEVYLTKESKREILKLKPGTVISITKIKKDKNNTVFLEDYNVLKSVEQNKSIENSKKAV